MDKNKVLEALKSARENSKKRKFDQTFDLIINFKDLDLKKKSLDVFLSLPHFEGRKVRVCAIVGKELEKKAKESCDEIVLESDLGKYSEKKLVKKLAKGYDFFIAQANLMGKIATVFGKVLGPLGKMPNPKLGGVLVPTGEVQPVVEKFKKSLRLMTKKEPIIKCAIGKESMKDEEVLENFSSVYDHIVHDLPKGEHNVRDVLIKLTMGKPARVGERVKKVEIKEDNKNKSKIKIEEKSKVEKKKPKEKIKIEDKK